MHIKHVSGAGAENGAEWPASGPENRISGAGARLEKIRWSGSHGTLRSGNGALNGLNRPLKHNID